MQTKSNSMYLQAQPCIPGDERLSIGGQSLLGSDEQGSTLIELALVLPLLILLLTGAVDLGRLCYVAIEVSAAATAGTSYGLQNLTDVAGMQQAALSEASDLSGATAAASWGCECADGTNASTACTSTPTCSGNRVSYIVVNASATLNLLFKCPGLPSSFTLKSSSRLRSGM